eukprot:10629071-Lingulodinium_polyedra.AAC.1
MHYRAGEGAGERASGRAGGRTSERALWNQSLYATPSATLFFHALAGACLRAYRQHLMFASA